MTGPDAPQPGGAGPGFAFVRVRLDIAYDGTDFSGWAIQPERRTVAGVVLAQLCRIFSVDGVTGLTVAGRTDAGVHATGQVAHVDVAASAWEAMGATLVRRLAGLLPPDVRVKAATRVPDAFDARFSALSRRYEYRIDDGPYGATPLRARDTLTWSRRLDQDALSAASAGLVGLHDFVAFCKRKEHASTIRAISRLDWRRDPDGVLVATVQADAFCQSMVRSLVGALIAVGEGRRTPDWPAAMLTRTERASDIAVAPPHGLNLVEVVYPADEELASRAEMTRNRRDLAPGTAG
jgi:tRNA pseudouridine38-40 synthase